MKFCLTVTSNVSDKVRGALKVAHALGTLEGNVDGPNYLSDPRSLHHWSMTFSYASVTQAQANFMALWTYFVELKLPKDSWTLTVSAPEPL